MLILCRDEIEHFVDINSAVADIEMAYRAFSQGIINQPPVGHIAFPEHDGDCHIKYGHIRGDEIFVIKIAAGFAQNAAQGLPSGNGLSLVLSARTGSVRAVLHDEMLLTDLRTAIGGAIVSRLLAKNAASRLLFVGTGVQARLQIETHLKLFGDGLTISLWGRSQKKAAEIASALSDLTDIRVKHDLSSACCEADVIVTTTGTTEPLILSDWIMPGTHITAVGADAPGKRELEPSLVARADLLVADSIAQCIDHGEFESFTRTTARAGDIIEVGAILSGAASGRANETQITIADLTGLAAQDIAIAKHVLERQQQSELFSPG